MHLYRASEPPLPTVARSQLDVTDPSNYLLVAVCVDTQWHLVSISMARTPTWGGEGKASLLSCTAPSASGPNPSQLRDAGLNTKVPKLRSGELAHCDRYSPPHWVTRTRALNLLIQRHRRVARARAHSCNISCRPISSRTRSGGVSIRPIQKQEG